MISRCSMSREACVSIGCTSPARGGLAVPPFRSGEPHVPGRGHAQARERSADRAGLMHQNLLPSSLPRARRGVRQAGCTGSVQAGSGIPPGPQPCRGGAPHAVPSSAGSRTHSCRLSCGSSGFFLCAALARGCFASRPPHTPKGTFTMQT